MRTVAEWPLTIALARFGRFFFQVESVTDPRGRDHGQGPLSETVDSAISLAALQIAPGRLQIAQQAVSIRQPQRRERLMPPHIVDGFPRTPVPEADRLVLDAGVVGPLPVGMILDADVRRNSLVPRPQPADDAPQRRPARFTRRERSRILLPGKTAV